MRWIRPIVLLGVVGAMITVVLARVQHGDGADATPQRRTAGAVAELAGSAEDDVERRLEALGYVETVITESDPEQSGVVGAATDESYPGVNVYCSVKSRTVRFIDLAGNLLHSLTLPREGRGQDCLVKPYEGGRFLALTEPYLALIDATSGVVWTSERRHHHDFSVGARGNIFALVYRIGSLQRDGLELPIRADAIAVLSPHGELLRQIDLLPLFERLISRRRIDSMKRLLTLGHVTRRGYIRESDVLHTNTIEWIPPGFRGFPRPQLLVGLRELDTIATIDVESGDVTWSWGAGVLDRPHQPSVLPGGNVLVFDNGMHRGFSRLLEVEPTAEEIVWEYRQDPPTSFFSRVRGGAQALPNGNVLVTESTKGRVFEVTREGEIVWSFLNPDFLDGRRRQIYRMNRYDEEVVLGTTSVSSDES